MAELLGYRYSLGLLVKVTWRAAATAPRLPVAKPARRSIAAFDAVITLNDHHLGAAGLTGREAEAVAAVCQAVEHLDSAGWIDVAAARRPWLTSKRFAPAGQFIRNS